MSQRKKGRAPRKLVTGLSIGALALALAIPTAAFAGDVEITRDQSRGPNAFLLYQPQKQLAANLALQSTDQDAEAKNDADQRASIKNYAPNWQVADTSSRSGNEVDVDADS